MTIKTLDEALLWYQVKNDSDDLVTYFDTFIQEYIKMIRAQRLNMNNRRLRHFIALFIDDASIRKKIRSNKYVTTSCYVAINQVLFLLHQIFTNQTPEETYHELIIPLLECAKKYNEIGIGFLGYVRKIYNFELKDYIKTKATDPVDFADRYDWFQFDQLLYINMNIFEEESVGEEEDVDVYDPRFLKGSQLSGIFRELSNIHRLILVKYYMDEWTDEKIGHSLAMHPKSVQRARQKIVDRYWDQIKKGEIKCLRIKPQVILLESYSLPTEK